MTISLRAPLLLAIASFLTLLAGCAPSEPSLTEAPAASATSEAPSPPTAEPAPQEATNDGTPADEPGALVLYSGRSESLVGPLVERYREETGAEIEVRYGGTAEMAATLLEEGDRSPADVFYAQDPGGLGAVDDLLAPLPEETLARVPSSFRDRDGRWIGISGRARVVAYHTATLSPEDLPQDLRGFTAPLWQGRLGWAPTNASFQTMITGMRAAWGEEETRAWLTAILDNEPVAYEGNTALVAAVAAGEVEVGLTNHYYLYRFLAEEGEDFGARNHFLSGGGPGSLVMVSGAGVLASSARPTAARALIDYLLGESAQRYFAGTTFEYPLAAEIAPAVELPALDSLNLIDLSLGELADLQGTVELLQEVGALP